MSEPPKSRPDYTLAVRRGELRFKNHHPDPRTSRYGQRLVEEILGCRMSGWLTPKLECNKKLQAIPCARLSLGLGLEAGRDSTPVVASCPGAIRRGSRVGRPGHESKCTPVVVFGSPDLSRAALPHSRGYHGPVARERQTERALPRCDTATRVLGPAWPGREAILHACIGLAWT